MSTTSEALQSCTCWEVRDEIWMCPHHIYRRGEREYESVSKVIHTLLPSDYAGIDPVVLETARLRGVFVDQYVCDWLRDPDGVLPLSDVAEMVAPHFPRDGDKYAKDVTERIERVIEWWGKSKFVIEDVQRIVWSESHGIAGTYDLGTPDMLLDIKCTANLMATNRLQLGAYLSMDKGPYRDPAILHVTKNGVKLMRYDRDACIQAWQTAVAWWKTLRELTNGKSQ